MLKKLALPTNILNYKQCLRLKRQATRLIDGDVVKQFSVLISRLENLKLHDERTKIRL